MNSTQAKAIALPDFLAQLSFDPAYERHGVIWYRSPFRPDERTPSFKVDPVRNVWFDFGRGEGGTIIDFVQQLYATGDVSRALAVIAEVTGTVGRVTEGANRANTQRLPIAPSVPSSGTIELARTPEIERVSAIADSELERYLLSRAIPVDLARVYLQEIHYRIGDERYRALAFENDSHGYEVRNPYFKGSLGKKDIRFLREVASAGVAARTDAAVFEGVYDFLSALVWHGRDRAQGNVLVLNSVSFTRRAVEQLRAAELATIHAYMDNDRAGALALAELRRGLITKELASASPVNVRDASAFYTGYKDVNEFVIARLLAARAE